MPIFSRVRASQSWALRSWCCYFSWHRGILFGPLFLLMTLCHGGLTASATAQAAPDPWMVGVFHSEESPAHVLDCAADAERIAPLERRLDLADGDQPADDVLDLAAWSDRSPCAHAVNPIASVRNLQILHQVFRI